MRTWKIVKWNGVRLVEYIVQGANVGEILNNSPGGMYDYQIISVTEMATSE